MNLSDLIEAVAVAGEQAMEATRRAYAANIEAFAPSGPPKYSREPPAGHGGIPRHSGSEAVAVADPRGTGGVGRRGDRLTRGPV